MNTYAERADTELVHVIHELDNVSNTLQNSGADVLADKVTVLRDELLGVREQVYAFTQKKGVYAN